MEIFDFAHVEQTFLHSAASYAKAEPFPHATFRELFNPDILREIHAEFPVAEAMSTRFQGPVQGGKYTESEFEKFGPTTQRFVGAVNSGSFCKLLTLLTGIPKLLSDPYLRGGGLHQTGRGGRLKVHSDFNVHPDLNLTRRLNMLVYLNEEWDANWGGQLELWNAEMTSPIVKVVPSLGTVVIFTCSDISFHGLPDPLDCPSDRFRRSLAFYYFTADSGQMQPRTTLWKARPGEEFRTDRLGRLVHRLKIR